MFWIIDGIYEWIDRRLPVSAVLYRVLRDPVPERGSWWYTLGAAIFLLLIIQVVTGIFLLLYYVPSWEGALDSIIYIQQQVFLGWLVRGIHYWNMVMLIILIGAHMSRTFISAAFKSPRELTWLLGVTLLLLMVATAFTGSLLRWDQSGYFDTVVGIKIASWTPLIGPWLAQLWRGSDVIGPATLTRNFALHVWILPAGLLLIAVVHIGLLVIQGQFGSWVNYEPEPPGSPPFTEDEIASRKKLEEEVLDPRSSKVNLPARTTWFYPFHIYKEAVVTLVLFVLVLVTTVLFPAPIDEPVDPTTTTYSPSSMWFLLFEDQLLLLFPGSWLVPIAATIAPGIVITLLFLLPWLERSPDIKPSLRPQAVAFYAVIVGAILVLSLLAASRVYNYDFINSRP
ncbi:MAG: cytochrome b N-terminal domain-containing protein [Chloroflexi bacterium]|nr:cytochrome b N-terminal domain-containing protein [Chloroflexota bacterium]